MASKQTQQNVTYEYQRVEALIPHPDNTRRHVEPDAGLIESIRQTGIRDALIVAPGPTMDGDYAVISGHHRLAAAKKLGLEKVPVAVHHDLVTREAQLAAIIEANAHRKDLSPAEEADAFQLMLSFDGYDVKRVAKETGVSQSRVRSRAKLTKLDDATFERVHDGQLTLERAEVLADFAKQRLKIGFGETSSDGKVTLEAVYCLGNCACAPSAMIDGQLRGRFDPQSLAECADAWGVPA